ncbi:MULTISPECIES: MarR family winged helix-turn-helix transcriptional regulator [unclassified Mesorhizobium]|uniref:MarR family winged helix-turn-helix transcriptional regulator n=1 Tax=unclassified Mesorhizobium TaxID=325217 RepID=UPI00086B08B8|nr:MULTISPECIES: MarR family winged helix-turn-helix transcriptional regulator [unclassified Mesorhizobium]MBN9258908.1 winged helix-turn-helix transcriptional regulator [Mesorhizobium sp.]MBN9270060.1 winged helix-turn-helix transcriptional regulator [Mesorhizobium sp.]ODT18057.1 MAG: MarR family transcriptional regulator [Mesorhizobium sp. SCN 65-12]OJX71823.1 MAG: MarR family transcriptional regulator [Mesorhizobium sp. 65-26]
MNDAARSPEGDALTDMILTMFRVNNLALTSGDRLVAPLGLTSARWQILGAIALADRSQPVAWLARDFGANRQNVQRIVNDLAKDGLVEFQPNPHHRRAHLVVLTEKGQRTYDAAVRSYNPLADALAEGLSLEEIKTAHRVMLALRQKLEGEYDAEQDG